MERSRGSSWTVAGGLPAGPGRPEGHRAVPATVFLGAPTCLDSSSDHSEHASFFSPSALGTGEWAVPHVSPDPVGCRADSPLVWASWDARKGQGQQAPHPEGSSRLCAGLGTPSAEVLRAQE